MDVGVGLHIQGHRGGHPCGGIVGLLGFPRPHIGAAVPSFLGLAELLLFRQHLLQLLELRIAAGGDNHFESAIGAASWLSGVVIRQRVSIAGRFLLPCDTIFGVARVKVAFVPRLCRPCRRKRSR
jgi:hypothetical protein